MTRLLLARSLLRVATLAAGLAPVVPVAAAAAPPAGATAAQALRAGRYEEARRLARARLPRAPGGGAAVVAAAQAEIALGLYPDARHRLEAAAAARPDDLPLRDALMRLLDLIG